MSSKRCLRACSACGMHWLDTRGRRGSWADRCCPDDAAYVVTTQCSALAPIASDSKSELCSGILLCCVVQKCLRELGPIQTAAQLQQQVSGMGLLPATQADLMSAF